MMGNGIGVDATCACRSAGAATTGAQDQADRRVIVPSNSREASAVLRKAAASASASASMKLRPAMVDTLHDVHDALSLRRRGLITTIKQTADQAAQPSGSRMELRVALYRHCAADAAIWWTWLTPYRPTNRHTSNSTMRKTAITDSYSACNQSGLPAWKVQQFEDATTNGR